VRGSNTEPIIRIVAEAETEAAAQKIVSEVYAKVAKLLSN
jgi:phosphomannomutase